MRLGVWCSFHSPYSSREAVQDFALWAEDLGLDSIWMGEHVSLFNENTFGYPDTKDGKIPLPECGGMLDITATFGFISSITKKIRLGTSVLLLPQRNPMYTAKEFATLDWLSNGRIDLGIGVGWNKEEVEACGYTFEDRGTRSDEFLKAICELWKQPVSNFDGKWIKFKNAVMYPKPIQKQIPIIIGGYSDAAFRRAARYGNGWYGFNMTTKRLREMLNKLDMAFENEGKKRDSSFEIIVSLSNQTINFDELEEMMELGIHRLIPAFESQKPTYLNKRKHDIEKLAALIK